MGNYKFVGQTSFDIVFWWLNFQIWGMVAGGHALPSSFKRSGGAICGHHLMMIHIFLKGESNFWPVNHAIEFR